MATNPTLDLLARVEAAQLFMGDVAWPLFWVFAAIVTFCVWNTIRRRDP